MQSTTNMNGYYATVAKWWEQAHEIGASISTSKRKYMPAHVQEKMRTAPNHGESCKHFQAGIRHIRDASVSNSLSFPLMPKTSQKN